MNDEATSILRDFLSDAYRLANELVGAKLPTEYVSRVSRCSDGNGWQIEQLELPSILRVFHHVEDAILATPSAVTALNAIVTTPGVRAYATGRSIDPIAAAKQILRAVLLNGLAEDRLALDETKWVSIAQRLRQFFNDGAVGIRIVAPLEGLKIKQPLNLGLCTLRELDDDEWSELAAISFGGDRPREMHCAVVQHQVATPPHGDSDSSAMAMQM